MMAPALFELWTWSDAKYARWQGPVFVGSYQDVLAAMMKLSKDLDFNIRPEVKR